MTVTNFRLDMSIEDATSVARALLPDATFESRPGAFFPRTIIRGSYRGLPVTVTIDKQQTQRNGIRPYTTVELGGGIAEVPIGLGGAHGGYPAYEAHVGFEQPALRDMKLIGAPAALIATLAGALGDRLAALNPISLHAGPIARRAGYDLDGSVLCVRGWPGDTGSLELAVETLVRMREVTYAEVPRLAPGAADLAQHPEVIRHAEGRAFARKLGRIIIACTFAVIVTAVVVTLAVLR